MKSILKVCALVVISVFVLSCDDDKNDALPTNPNSELSTKIKTNLTKHSKNAVNAEKNLLNIILDSRCFNINYPVSFINDQNITVTAVKNDKEYTELLFSFPVKAELKMVYPIKVTLENGNQRTITTFEEHNALRNTCEAACDDCEENCFVIAYPITLIKEDNAKVTINGDQEIFSFLEGLTDQEYFNVSYPINVIVKGGKQQTLKNDEELSDLLVKCFLP